MKIKEINGRIDGRIHLSGINSRIDGEYIKFRKYEDLEVLALRACRAKGRYHSQEAMCDLMDYLGIPNIRFKDNRDFSNVVIKEHGKTELMVDTPCRVKTDDEAVKSIIGYYVAGDLDMLNPVIPTEDEINKYPVFDADAWNESIEPLEI